MEATHNGLVYLVVDGKLLAGVLRVSLESSDHLRLLVIGQVRG